MQQIQYVECTTYLDTAYLHSYIFQMYAQYTVVWKYLQGPRTQIDAFQTNIFSLLNDILTKRKLFLETWDREIW